MNSGNISEEEMKYLIDKYSGENIDKVLATGLLSHPFASAGPRQHMFSTHYSQHVMIQDPETPRNFTGYEKQFGKYLNSFEKAKKNYDIIGKVIRHSSFPEMMYTLILRERGTNNYDIVKVSHYEKLSDQHGYLRPFTYVDKKGVGSVISKDDVIYKSNSLDAMGNYRYGKNAKVAYMFIHEVKEDSIVVSEEFADSVKFNLVTKTELDIQKNDVLLNIYGNLQEYKSIPSVGEYVNSKGILLAVRQMEKKNISADFTDMALTNLYYTDNKFGAHGQVVDIDIKVNDIEELQKDPHREQLYNLYMDQLRYYQELVNIMQPIANDQNNHITDRFTQCLFTARTNISPDIKYSSNTGNFEFAHITIYTADTQSLRTAMKLTNRCGAKAVIGKIWPKENMPVDENGTRADLICSAAGLVGRTNPDQLFEQLINFISDEVLRRMKKCKTTEESAQMLIKYLKDMSPEWGEYTEGFYKSRTKQEKEEFLNNLYNSKLGIMMYNPPAHNSIGWEKLKKITKDYKIKVSKVKMCRSYKVSKEIADMYDTTENIENVKNFMNNFVFDSSTKVLKKKDKNGKVIKETITEIAEFGLDKLFEKNPLKLSKKEYEENKWTDNYIWSENETGIQSLVDDHKPEEMTDYVKNIQALESLWNREEFLESQIKESTFDTTKSRVFRKDETTLVREFTSRYPVIIADVYMMLLKQMPDAAFSARSLGTVTPLGLPNKSIKRAEIGKPYGDTCNQIGDMENTDLKNLVDPEKVARFFAVQSTNPALRSEMARQLLFEDPRHLHDIPINDDEITDTIPAKEFAQYLSAIGLEIADIENEDPYEFLDGIKYRSLPELMKKVGVTPENNPFSKVAAK